MTDRNTQSKIDDASRHAPLWRAALIAGVASLGLALMGWTGALISTTAVTVALCFVPQDRARATSPARRLSDEPELWGS